MKRKSNNHETKGPSQRQLRFGENIRHILVEIFGRGEVHDVALQGISITVGEVRMSPDLRHANIFVAALGNSQAKEIAKALNHASGFLRNKLAQRLDAKFVPKLNFIGDDSYDFAVKIDELLAQPKVQKDLERKIFKLEDNEDA